LSTTDQGKPWAFDFILLAAVWGASFLFMRIGVIEFGPFATAGVRVAIASAFLLPFLLYKGLGPSLLLHWKHVFFVGVLNSAIPFVCFSFALLSITTGLSSMLNATVPLFGALVAWFWLHDKPTRSRALGLLIGFMGVTMLAWDQAGVKAGASGIAPVWAVLAGLFACACYAVSASYTRRFLADVPALVIATGSQIGAMLSLALPALWFRPAQMPSISAWLALLAVGVASSGIAYILFFRLIANAGPARALSVTYVVPVFAVLYGLIFLGEQVTPWMLLCGAVIVAGTALSTGLLKLKRPRSSL
jgi:drug/metabolite transporter (DMT)-like permease